MPRPAGASVGPHLHRSEVEPEDLPPAGRRYRLDVREIQGERREVVVSVVTGEEVVHMVEMGGGGD